MTDTGNPPTHLGIILDGNRRWAKQNGLSSFDGHTRGYENFKEISTYALNRGIKFLSAYMFSSENWSRARKEVNFLMSLAMRMVTRDIKEMHKDNIRVVWVGSPDKLDKKLVTALKDAEELTKNNTKATLCICFNYGGKQEVVDAVRKIINQKSSAENVTEETIDRNIYKPDIPPIDLVIRTSGEERLSGFMLWRCDYAEFMFSKKTWPEFSKSDLDDAIENYSSRNRRFGK